MGVNLHLQCKFTLHLYQYKCSVNPRNGDTIYQHLHWIYTRLHPFILIYTSINEKIEYKYLYFENINLVYLAEHI